MNVSLIIPSPCLRLGPSRVPSSQIVDVYNQTTAAFRHHVSDFLMVNPLILLTEGKYTILVPFDCNHPKYLTFDCGNKHQTRPTRLS